MEIFIDIKGSVIGGRSIGCAYLKIVVRIRLKAFAVVNEAGENNDAQHQEEY